MTEVGWNRYGQSDVFVKLHQKHLFFQNSNCIGCGPTTESMQIFRQFNVIFNSLSHFNKGWQVTSLSSHCAWHFFFHNHVGLVGQRSCKFQHPCWLIVFKMQHIHRHFLEDYIFKLNLLCMFILSICLD